MTYVPERFTSRVRIHILANLMKIPPAGMPVILAIHGSPGTGKSFQLDQVLAQSGTYYKTISSSELESENANDPARLLRKTYLDVADAVSSKGYYSGALIINDIDSSLGNWGPLVQTTVNRQLVIGELQHISDYPAVVDNRRNLRIPIIMTANDLTKLYGPLLRPGRTSTFFWEPNSAEIIEMLKPLMPHLPSADVAKFVESTQSHSITTYVDAIRIVAENKLAVLASDFQESVLRARKGDLEAEVSPSLAELLAALEIQTNESDAQRDYSKVSI